MKFLIISFIIFTMQARAQHFAEIDALNPLFYAADTSHSLRTDIRAGRLLDGFDVSVRYAQELGVSADSEGSGVKGRDGNAHHLGLRGAFYATEHARIGAGYVYSLFSADVNFNGEKSSLNKGLSGFEVFASYQWNFTQWYIRPEVNYHHTFGDIKKKKNGGLAEYDIGQGKLSLLVGYQF